MFEQAAAIDNQFADLQFHLGRCYGALRQYDKAHKRYLEARDLDALRLRADSKINNLIREVAGSTGSGGISGVHLVDTEHAFQESSPHKIPGENLFYEHVHMNFTGNYLLALKLFNQIEKIITKVSSPQTAGKQPLSEAECEKRLAFTPWNRYNIAKTNVDIVQDPPFTNQLDHIERLRRLQQQLQDARQKLQSGGMEQSIAEYRQALKYGSQDWVLHMNFGNLLLETGNANAAIEHFQVMQQQLPHSPWVGRFLIQALHSRGTKLTEQDRRGKNKPLMPRR